MKPSDIKKLIMTRLGYGSALVDDNAVAQHLNYVLDVLAGYINDKNKDYFFNVSHQNLISGQHLYQFNGIFKIRNVYANLKENATDPDNIVRLYPLYKPSTFSDDQIDDIEGFYGNSDGEAFYEKRGDNIFLYTGSFVDVTNGLTLEYYSQFKTIIADPTNGNFDIDLSVSDNSGSGVPSRFHSIIADAVSYFFKMAGDKVLPLTSNEQMWQVLLQEKVMNLSDDIQDDVHYREIPSIPI